MIEGFYFLEEVHVDTTVLRPPQVDGRFVLKDGAVLYVMLNNADETNKTSITQFGTFILDETSFSYGYDTRSNFRQTAAGVTKVTAAAFEGMRRFVISVEGPTVHLNSGQQEFIFTDERMTYSENGKLLRVYRRSKQ